MTTHTRVTIGTKPAAAIIAEFKATLPVFHAGKPDGAGWLESVELMTALGIGRSTFQRAAHKNVAAGIWERKIGSKLGANGRPAGAYYYRVIKPCKPARKAG